MNKVVTVDIGNSNIVAGIWYNTVLKDTLRFATRRDYSEKDITEKLCAFLGNASYDGAILSSVVPEINDMTLNALEKLTGKEPLLMGPFLSSGIDISDYDEKRLGTDRIVDLAAAASMCKDRPVMVCDLGTCTTISVIDAKKKLLGGMICPGIQMSLDAQHQRTSQLPQLSAGEVKDILGKDTASNMISGTVAATGLMISAAAERIKNDYKLENMALVITGGLGKFVLPWIEYEAQYEPNLLLRGLLELYNINETVSDVDTQVI